MAKTVKEQGEVLKDASGQPIPDYLFGDDPTERMRQAAVKNVEKEPLEDFLRRIGVSEETIKKVT